MTAHWILFYDYVPDYLERRGAIRGEHFAHATAYKDRGELLMAGAFTDPKVIELYLGTLARV